MATPSADTDELARFGYEQELDRSLGLFSSFAAGFSYISIMTGLSELFFWPGRAGRSTAAITGTTSGAFVAWRQPCARRDPRGR